MKNWQSNDLSFLLNEASKLFKTYPKGNCIHTFELVNHNGGWSFKIINSWHKWMDKNLEFEFGWFREPEGAVKGFLFYVDQHKINVKKLQH
jgi:hypothetical protein